jgi:hypothetical protein
MRSGTCSVTDENFSDVLVLKVPDPSVQLYMVHTNLPIQNSRRKCKNKTWKYSTTNVKDEINPEFVSSAYLALSHK